MTKDPDNVKRGRNSKMRGKAIEREVRDLLRALIIEAYEPEVAVPHRKEDLAWRNPDNGSQVADVETREVYGLCPLEEGAFEVKSNQSPTPKRRLKAWSQAKEAERQTGKRPYIIECHVDQNKRTFWLVQQLEWPEKESSE